MPYFSRILPRTITKQHGAAAPHRDEVAEAALVALNGRLLLRQLAHTADPRQQAPVRDVYDTLSA
jgi:hypothetical protein